MIYCIIGAIIAIVVSSVYFYKQGYKQGLDQKEIDEKELFDIKQDLRKEQERRKESEKMIVRIAENDSQTQPQRSYYTEYQLQKEQTQSLKCENKELKASVLRWEKMFFGVYSKIEKRNLTKGD